MAIAHDCVRDYLKSIETALRSGHASEHTHRPSLERLIEALSENEVDAINEPRRIACGAPDFIVVRGTVPVGHIEAKDVGANLLKTERTEQVQRYLESLSNFVLTDYLSFRWYVDGELRLSADLPRPAANGKIRWNEDAASRLSQLLHQFLAADIPLRATPHALATSMAGMARLIRELITQTFTDEGRAGELHAQLEAFRKVLLELLTTEQFADMYAQTLCYGLFAARCTAPTAPFTRQIAASALPKTNPFLRKLFHTIAGPDLDDRIAWAVDQLAELLARADIRSILDDFGRKTRTEDPVVHFYETFLAAYDPKMRESRGVYYTPEPIVGYIVRSVDTLLASTFGMKDGLAHAKKVRLKRPKAGGKGDETYETHRLQILDPATGTGTFLYAVIAKIRERFAHNEGAWPGYVAEHLLPRVFGFELLMAPYAVAHMKLGLELEQSGYDFATDQRLSVFLTNSLEEAHELTGLPLFTQWLADESRAASAVKRDAPVMVVLGNPPYSGHSINKGAWIEDLMTEYKQSPELNKPAQKKWLSDDYVKFIRFAQWRVQQTGHGIVSFVTNHGYLDNPTFMDMRRSLLNSFDDIYVFNLHGNSKKKEVSPDGTKDENVFDIQQGVSISIFVKHAKEAIQRTQSSVPSPTVRNVFYADLYGSRAKKYDALDRLSVSDTTWQKIDPQAPSYLFVPQDIELLREYERGWSLREIFAPYGDPAPGIVTTHDEFAISFTAKEAAEKVERLLSTETEEEARAIFRLCSQNQWQYRRAKQELKNSHWRELIVPILYRPFDMRWTVYDKNVAVHRRERLSSHMLQPGNLSLITARSNKSTQVDHFFVATGLQETKCGERTTQSQGFPLWLHGRENGDLLAADAAKQANLSPRFLESLARAIDRQPSPEDIFFYLYGVLYTPSYRERYADFLRRDYPSVPLPPQSQVFEAFSAIGRELVGLHTLNATVTRVTRYEVAGSNLVDSVSFVRTAEDFGRVYINAAQYFDRVPTAVWEMQIGGYRVADRWLKERKGRQLTYDELTEYQLIIAALGRTLELQRKLDDLVHERGGWPLN